MYHDKQNNLFARQLAAFPLVAGWQEIYWSLPLYLPNLAVGEMVGAPPGVGLPALPLPPVKESLARDWRNFHPGELSQWGIYQGFIESQDEGKDLLQAIRGNRPAPRPPAPDPSLIWTLARQLEKMQVEQEKILENSDQQQSAIDSWLAPEAWEEESQSLAASWQRSSLSLEEPPDPELTKLRLLFWRLVLDTHLQFPYVPVVLQSPRGVNEIKTLLTSDPAAGESYQARFILPACRNNEELAKARETLAAAGTAGSFKDGLGNLMEATTRGQTAFAAAQAALTAIITRQIEPALGLSPEARIICEFSHITGLGQGWPPLVREVLSGPMLFWLPA